MTIETSIDALVIQTTTLLETCVTLKDSTTQLIANAVIVSENASIDPIIIMATNLIDTQTLLIKHVSRIVL